MRVYRLVTAGPGWQLCREERAAPALADEQVLVEVEAAAVAGPELAAVDGDAVPGGAAVGTAVSAGGSADHLLGQRVAVGPVQPCGECDRCRRGLAVVCRSRTTLGRDADGALATHVVAGARWLLPLADPIEIPGPEAALVGREAALAYALYARAGIAPGQRAVVVGRGPIARLALEILAAKGVRPIALAVDEAWAEIAAQTGARAVPGSEVPASERRRLVREEAARGAESAGPYAVLETTGTSAGRALALDLALPGATVALLSAEAAGAAPGPCSGTEAAIDAHVSLLGVAGAHPDLLPEVAALAAQKELDLAGASEVVRPDEVPDVLARLARGDMPGRAAVVTPA